MTTTLIEADKAHLVKTRKIAEFEAQIAAKKVTAINAIKSKNIEITNIQKTLNSDIAAIQSQIDNL